MTNENGANSLNSATPEAAAARRYALAAFQLANERGEADKWKQALREIAGFMGDPEVRRVLENTRVGQEPKQRLVTAALADLPELALNLAKLLVRKGRTDLAVEVSHRFEYMLDQQRGISRARATTAVPLSDGEREILAKQLKAQTGSEVILETAVEPALLGGVIIQVGDRLIDASTRAKLAALRHSMMNSG